MAPNSPPNTSTSFAAVSTSVATIAQTITFADQSQSRLMTLPTELRNKIYEFVFCDNSTYVYEAITYEWVDDLYNMWGISWKWKVETEMAYVPRPIRLDRTTPPSKNSILACRKLYSEMKQMQAAAYRSYWTTNRFLYVKGEMSALPTTKDMKRIKEFIIVMHRDYHIRIAWKGFQWHSKVLPGDTRTHHFHGIGGAPYIAKYDIQAAVHNHVASGARMWYDLDPRTGDGLTQGFLAAISQLEDIKTEIESVSGEDFV